MQIVSVDYASLPKVKPSSCAVGYFDGFHTGHQQLLKEAKKHAMENKEAFAIMTFDPDPWTIFRPNDNRDHLLCLEDKKNMAKAMGADLLYVVSFSKDFASLSVEAFHQMIQDLKIDPLICGFDFTYASKGQGNVETLKSQDDFDVYVVESINDQRHKISSTRIEKLIRGGQIVKANQLLGYCYSLPGMIVHGYGRGSSKLGYPTANLKVEEDLVMPANGVYAGYVLVEGEFYPAMINVGTNPTFNNQKITIEAWLQGCERDLYGKMARYFFVERMRPEIRFDGIDALRGQLKKDASRIEPLLARQENLWAQTVCLWRKAGVFDILKA